MKQLVQKVVSIVSVVRIAPCILLCGVLATGACLRANDSRENVPALTWCGEAESVPAEINSHLMFVDVMVNGHGPFRFMVDTGCSITLISADLADAIGAPAPVGGAQAVVAQNGLGSPATVLRSRLEQLDLGGASFYGVPVAVTDTFDAFSLLDGRRVDGALGYSLFRDVYLGLDFPRQRLLLGSVWPAKVPKVCATLPVSDANDVPMLLTELQGKSLEVLLDTGANQALQLPPEKVSDFSWKVEPKPGALVAVVGEAGREWVGRLNGAFSLGGLQQFEPACIVSTGVPRIGVRTLDKYCVVFHPSEGRMWLCGENDALPRPLAERSNGLSLYSDPEGWRIAGVIPGSPAAKASLTIGSLITKIEATPAAQWTRDQIEQWTEAHDAISLVVANGVIERTVNLPVWDLVP